MAFGRRFQALTSLTAVWRNRLQSQRRPYGKFEVAEAAYPIYKTSIGGANSKVSQWFQDVFSSAPLRQVYEVAAMAVHKDDIQLPLRRKRQENRNLLCHRLTRGCSFPDADIRKLYHLLTGSLYPISLTWF